MYVIKTRLSDLANAKRIVSDRQIERKKEEEEEEEETMYIEDRQAP